ncbi:MAG TPA: HipA family kinase [Polyangia bacterium]|nr:HipA family kinase [Polyangia bacterium]
MRTVAAVRYGTPLREGGSLPAIVEADDGAIYVAKFRGAGQGTQALVPEIIVGTLARALGLRMPELVLLELPDSFGRSEPDSEIRELLGRSAGLNLGVSYLAGALGFDPAVRAAITGDLAARIVVFDAFAMNVDRTARNPNLLWWNNELWLIDHGAALYFHHDWQGGTAGADRPFAMVRDHVLLASAEAIEAAGEALARALTDETLRAAIDLVPDSWLTTPAPAPSAAARRAEYYEYLRARRDARSTFIGEAVRARALRV